MPTLIDRIRRFSRKDYEARAKAIFAPIYTASDMEADRETVRARIQKREEADHAD